MIRDDEKKCGAPATDKKEIEIVMGDLESEVESIQHLVDRLLGIIDPIIRVAGPTEDGDQKEMCTTTALGGSIYNYVKRLRNTNDTLNDTILRIEL